MSMCFLTEKLNWVQSWDETTSMTSELVLGHRTTCYHSYDIHRDQTLRSFGNVAYSPAIEKVSSIAVTELDLFMLIL